ncbi:Innexin inx1 [Eumeta japonica]|uniref:Innexin inx1 n=1 Tax=Eumeta variegata TaxID=151549 RepID=A0A4C1TTB9_EUMVA|nr:Innexin inx1 [Eumeta japonica]
MRSPRAAAAPAPAELFNCRCHSQLIPLAADSGTALLFIELRLLRYLVAARPPAGAGAPIGRHDLSKLVWVITCNSTLLRSLICDPSVRVGDRPVALLTELIVSACRRKALRSSFVAFVVEMRTACCEAAFEYPLHRRRRGDQDPQTRFTIRSRSDSCTEKCRGAGGGPTWPLEKDMRNAVRSLSCECCYRLIKTVFCVTPSVVFDVGFHNVSLLKVSPGQRAGRRRREVTVGCPALLMTTEWLGLFCSCLAHLEGSRPSIGNTIVGGCSLRWGKRKLDSDGVIAVCAHALNDNASPRPDDDDGSSIGHAADATGGRSCSYGAIAAVRYTLMPNWRHIWSGFALELDSEREAATPTQRSLKIALHNIFTTVLLLICSMIITATQYVGQPIQCIVHGLPTHVINTFCWITSTFAMPDAFKREDMRKIRFSGRLCPEKSNYAKFQVNRICTFEDLVTSQASDGSLNSSNAGGYQSPRRDVAARTPAAITSTGPPPISSEMRVTSGWLRAVSARPSQVVVLTRFVYDLMPTSGFDRRQCLARSPSTFTKMTPRSTHERTRPDAHAHARRYPVILRNCAAT